MELAQGYEHRTGRVSAGLPSPLCFVVGGVHGGRTRASARACPYTQYKTHSPVHTIPTVVLLYTTDKRYNTSVAVWRRQDITDKQQARGCLVLEGYGRQTSVTACRAIETLAVSASALFLSLPLLLPPLPPSFSLTGTQYSTYSTVLYLLCTYCVIRGANPPLFINEGRSQEHVKHFHARQRRYCVHRERR